MEDCIICGGIVYDGTGNSPQKADILLKNGKIAEISNNCNQAALPIIDATNCIVTPGFVDIHRHCDIAPFASKNFGTTELMQGITSTVAGNCGLSPVPLNARKHLSFYNYIEPVTGKIPTDINCSSFNAYTQNLKKSKLPINMGYLAAMGAIRYAVKGFDETPFSSVELSRASDIIDTAMSAGAFGLSLGIMYRPECYTKTAEYDLLVKQAAKHDGILCTHMRGEGDSLVNSVKEVLDIAQRADIRLEISHLKSTGMRNWHDKIFRAIELIDNARANGQCVTADFYPYDGGSTTLLSLLPPTLLAAAPESFSTTTGRGKLRDELYKTHQNWDNMVTSIGWSRILISSVTKQENIKYQGLTFEQAAKAEGYDDPVDLMSSLIATEGGNVGIIIMSMSWEDVQTVAKLPYTALISDSLYGGGNPHPRLYGAFPRMICKMVVEDKLMPMEQAIYKMTGLPTKIMNIKGRGILAEGYAADLLVFNPKKITDKATYEKPCQNASGMQHVFLNGLQIIENGKKLDVSAGEFLEKKTKNERE